MSNGNFGDFTFGNYIFTVPGNGPISRILQGAIIPLADVNFDNAFLKLSPYDETPSDDAKMQQAIGQIVWNTNLMKTYGINRPYEHIMGYALAQTVDTTYRDIGYLPMGKMYNRHDPIELSPRLNDYKRVLRKLHIQNEIKTRVDYLCDYVNINEKTLGVHVRLTSESGPSITYDDYCRTIDAELETGNYNRMYVATDNVESLIKLEERYRSVICYYPSLMRLPTEQITDNDQWAWKYNVFFCKQYWQEALMEAMTLSRCAGLICKDSNFSNMAIVFSNTLKKITRVAPSE